MLWILGVCTVSEPWSIVTEFCEFGDLKSTLIRHMNVAILFQKDELLRFATQIASGMSYLSSLKVCNRAFIVNLAHSTQFSLFIVIWRLETALWDRMPM